MRSSLLAVLLLVATLAGACGAPLPPLPPLPPPPLSAQPAAPITLRVQLGSEPLTLDPTLAGDVPSMALMEPLFVGLTRISNTTEEVEPALAESWSVSDDGLTWTFHMRPDAVWSDGTPVTAKDVVYSARRAAMPEMASPYAYVLYNIKNAKAINQSARGAYNLETLGVTALDDHTVQFTLNAPAPYFASIVSLPVLRPLPAWAIENHGIGWTAPANIVTDGPYRLVERSPNKRYVFAKNPTYYGADGVQIDRIEGKFYPSTDSALVSYEHGDLDVTDQLSLFSPDMLAKVRQDPVLGAELHVGPGAGTTYVGFTMTKPPFDNVLVRKAFSAAIDRDALARARGAATPATQFAPKGIFGAPDPEVGIGYDPVQARAWLAEAGYPDGKGFPPVTMQASSQSPAAAALRKMWQDTLHVDVTLDESKDGADFYNSLEPDTPLIYMPGLWVLSWYADYPDENNWVLEVFHCEDSPNQPRAACTRADDLAEAAGHESDPAKRRALYKEVEQMMFADEVRAAPLLHPGYSILTKPYVQRTYPTFAPIDWDTWKVHR